MEQVLQISENRFRRILNDVPTVAVQGYTEDGAIIYWNSASEKLYGYGANEAIGKNLLELIIPPEIQSSVRQAIQQMVKTGKPIPAAELSLMHKDGSRVEVYSSHSIVTVPGRKTELFCLDIDLTERKKAEAELVKSKTRAQETNALLRAIMESPQGIVIFALDANLCYTAFTVTHKATMQALWGVEIKVGMNMLDTISNPPDREKAGENFKRVLHGEQFILIEEYGDPEKYRAWYEDRYSPIRDESGAITGVTVFVTDITERKRAENALQARLRLSQFADFHSLDEFLQQALDEAEALTGSKIGFAHFIDADQKSLHLQTWSNNTLKNMCAAEGKGEHYPVDKAGVWADCVATRAPLIHNDYPNLAHRKGLPKGHAPIQREIVVPVLHNDLIVMILGVGNKPTDYDDFDVEALSELANSVWDIVQRKQAENALKESEKKYRLLHESMTDGFVSVDMNGNFIEGNEIYQKMLGYTQAELAQLTYKDITPEKWFAFEMDIVENQIIKRGYSDIYEKEYIRKNGTVFPVELHTVLLRDEQGKPAGMWAIVRDITERKMAEEALNESHELFSLFMFHSPVYTFIKEVTPDESRVLQASENYKKMIGIAGRDMIGRTMQELFPPETAAKFTADDWSVVTTGQAIKLDEELNEHHYTTIKFPITQGNKTLLAGYTIDITEQELAKTALKNSELFIKSVLNSLTAHIAVLDRQGKIVTINEAWRKFARENDSPNSTDYVGSNYLDACQAAIEQGDLIAKQVHQGIRAVLDGLQSQFNIEYSCHSPTRQRWFTVTVLPMYETGSGLVVLHQDITERKQAENSLRESEERFYKAFHSGPVGLAITRASDGVYIDVNEAFSEIVGFSRKELTGHTSLELNIATPEQRQSYTGQVYKDGFVYNREMTLRNKSGELRVALGSMEVIEINHGTCVLSTAIDITERKQAEDELRRAKELLTVVNRDLKNALAREMQLAHTDSLTGINNRRRLYELAEHEFEIAVRYQQPLSVMMFDIDYFKKVNDTFGHAVGDQILQRVTQIACAELRSADVLGRYGGEEFVAILPMTNAQQAYPLAERIRLGAKTIHVATEKGDATVTLSIGIIEMVHGAQAMSVEALIHAADESMYSAKQAGRNQTKIGG
jgi:diguanylate cyclase (GGDEF)-like protein/PAS domain S-box-containing protein